MFNELFGNCTPKVLIVDDLSKAKLEDDVTLLYLKNN